MKRKSFIKNASLFGMGSVLLPEQTLFGKGETFSFYPELEEHTLVKAEIVFANYNWPRLVGRNSRKGVHGQFHKSRLLKLYSNKGAMGWGLTGLQTIDEVMPLYGKKISSLLHPENGLINSLHKPIDFALYDLAGIILNKPVYQMLGARGTTMNTLYSGMIYMDELNADNYVGSVDRILENCEWDYKYGYRQLKIKIGRSGQWYPHDEGLKKDIEVVNLIYNNFKSRGVQLLVDANDSYSLEDTIAFLKGIKDVPLYWMEEPFAEEEQGCRSLKKWMMSNGFDKTYYADGEARTNQGLCMSLLKDKVLDVALMDTQGYGFSNWISLLTSIKSMGGLASPHAWGDKLKTNYTAHLASGIGATCTIEGVTCFSNDIGYGKYAFEDGVLTVSNDPGFGMKLLV